MRIDQNAFEEFLLKPEEKIMRKGNSFDIDIGNAGGVLPTVQR